MGIRHLESQVPTSKLQPMQLPCAWHLMCPKFIASFLQISTWGSIKTAIYSLMLQCLFMG